MPKGPDRAAALAVIEDFFRERDAHLARIDPSLPKSTPLHDHVSEAYFEAWVDGELSDEQINALMESYRSCPRCVGNYEFYRQRKAAGYIEND